MTGVPTKAYRLPSEWVQPNTTVVNVASFKNVDEEALLKIPGVVYVPMVGKVTVAMLERNLVRLFDQFHHPDHNQHVIVSNAEITNSNRQQQQQPWYGHPINLYTAIGMTVLLAMELSRR